MLQFVLKVNDEIDKPPTLREAIRAAKKLVHYDALMAFLATQEMSEPERLTKAAVAVAETIGCLWIQPPGEWPQQLKRFISIEGGFHHTITLEDAPCLDYPVSNTQPGQPSAVPPES